MMFLLKPFLPDTIYLYSNWGTTKIEARFAEFSDLDFFDIPFNLKCEVTDDGNYLFYKKWPPYFLGKNVVLQPAFLASDQGANITVEVKPGYIYLIPALMSVLIGLIILVGSFQHGQINLDMLQQAPGFLLVVPLFIMFLCYRSKRRLVNSFLIAFDLKKSVEVSVPN